MTEPLEALETSDDVPEVCSLDAAFHHVLGTFTDVCLPETLDEETLTSSIFGGLVVTFPLFVQLYGSGSGKNETCYWGQYKKSRSARAADSEAERGADFALAISDGPDSLRVAVFQAKKGKVTSTKDSGGKAIEQWFLNVHRRPKKPESGDWRESQMVRLVRTGRFFQLAKEAQERLGSVKKAIDFSNDVMSPDKVASSSLTLSDLNWIHYLGYYKAAPICVGLNKLSKATFARECEETQFQNHHVPIEDNLGPKPFFDLLLAGLAAGTGDGWLRLNIDLATELLPSLINLMPVIVAQGRGGRELQIQNAGKLSKKLAIASTDAQKGLLAQLHAKLKGAPKPPRIRSPTGPI